ncbi:hypothetical protein Hanom_Chr07g00671131 [Helianthus anomalus]
MFEHIKDSITKMHAKVGVMWKEKFKPDEVIQKKDNDKEDHSNPEGQPGLSNPNAVMGSEGGSSSMALEMVSVSSVPLTDDEANIGALEGIEDEGLQFDFEDTGGLEVNTHVVVSVKLRTTRRSDKSIGSDPEGESTESTQSGEDEESGDVGKLVFHDLEVQVTRSMPLVHEPHPETEEPLECNTSKNFIE